MDNKGNVILTRRRHWINFFPIMFACAVLLIFVMLGSFYAGLYRDAIQKLLPLGIVTALLAVVTILVALILVLGYWVYWQNRLVLTDTHLIQYNRQGLFNSSIIELNLENIQDVRSSKKGVIPTLLNYGDVMVDTAGQELNMTFFQVASPNELAEQIMELCRKRQPAKPA